MFWIIASETVRVELVEPWWKDVLLPVIAVVLSLASIGLTLILRWRDGVRLKIEFDQHGSVIIRNVGRHGEAVVHGVQVLARRGGFRRGAPLVWSFTEDTWDAVEYPVTVAPGHEVTILHLPILDAFNQDDWATAHGGAPRQVRAVVRHGYGTARSKWTRTPVTFTTEP
ncbi:hypothetical protein M3G09_004915 [Micrococcus luteus]|nr:hypothetical protein [Micrococcus luteus]